MPRIIPYTPAQQLARQIKLKRKILRLSQSELAKRAGTSQTAVARLELSRGNPTLHLIQRLSDALNLELILTINPQQPIGPTPTWLTDPAA